MPLQRWAKQRREGKRAVGGEFVDVNNILLNACPAFRKRGKHVHLHTLAHGPLTVPLLAPATGARHKPTQSVLLS